VERLIALKTEHGIKKEITYRTEQERYQIRKREEIKDSCYMKAKLENSRRLSIRQKHASGLGMRRVEGVNFVTLDTE